MGYSLLQKSLNLLRTEMPDNFDVVLIQFEIKELPTLPQSGNGPRENYIVRKNR